MSEAPNVSLPIYLDYQATTPTDPRVVDGMLPYFTEKFGNPHSVSHAFGAEAADAVEAARAEVAALIGAEPREIVFTSGATESNNLALKGAAYFQRDINKRKRNKIVSVATEHKCVIETCKRLEREGFEIAWAPIDDGGLIDLAALAALVDERTIAVSVMAVNNEIGVIQPLAEIGAICRSAGALFHSDCAQAVGKMPLDVGAMNIGLMSISGHKVYGPKGIGVLYVRRRPRVRLVPLIDGGGQERGNRSGTLPAPLCVGLGVACRIAGDEMAGEAARLRGLRDRLMDGIAARLDGVSTNGDMERRIPGNLNLSFAGIEAQALMEAMPDVAVSTGSACTSAAVEPSYVLRAIGVDDARADGSIRFGIGRFTAEAEIDYAIDAVVEHVAALRAGAVRESA